MDPEVRNRSHASRSYAGWTGQEVKAKLSTSVKDTNPKDFVACARVPLWLCSPIAKAHWAVAQFAGLIKYGAWNWRVKGVRNSVYISAIQRHLDAYESGEELDPIDQTHHLGNIMANAAILLDAAEAGKLIDDRPPSVSVRPLYARLERSLARLQQVYADRHPKHFTIKDVKESVARRK